jgi:anthranilate phosphoribosyltransferase
MDEITLTTETVAAEVTTDGVRLFMITPEAFGLKRCTMQDLKGGDATQNSVIVRAVLSGEQGPRRDVVLLNAAYALLAVGSCATPEEGIQIAAAAIDDGRALAQLDKLVAATNR